MRFRAQVQALSRRPASKRLSEPGGTPIHVVAGVLLDPQRGVLLAQRPAGKPLAGGWEFPGGKLEPGEARRAGLQRELYEELGIETGTLRPLLKLRHSYPHGEVLLDFWLVRDFRGEPRGREGQALCWWPRAQLASAPLLPADLPVLSSLRLPERLGWTGGTDYEIRPAREFDTATAHAGRLLGARGSTAAQLLAAERAGAQFLALEVALAPDELHTLCEHCCAPVYTPGLSLGEAWALGASGVLAAPYPANC